MYRFGDPEVTLEDHHAIAEDMRSWVSKVKDHTSYMSDVITAVKGQAISSTEVIDSFTKLHGSMNSLVQVIDNLISNAIQAYGGKPDNSIDFSIDKIDNSLVITIKDYGCGMSLEVQDKLFKEMITTKGKNGTGLGLYMSYSNIKAKFNGNITFESEAGKGTTFKILLPIS